MPRSARPTKKPLAGVSSDDEDSSTPQDVAPETPNVRTRTTRTLAANYGGSKSNTAYQAFADALRQAMSKQKLSASEVARQIWGTSTDSRGYTVAKNRDRIGHYLAGTSYPEPDNLVKLAEAVGVPVEELQIERPEGNPGPRRVVASGVLQLTHVTDRQDKMRLQVDRVIDWRLALQIADLLKEAEMAELKIKPGDVINREIPDAS